METEGRPKHGARRRCSDPKKKGCKGFARRNTVPPVCPNCGGGSRAGTKHEIDPETGKVLTSKRGLVSVPPRVQALLDGEIAVEDLDDEELARGYPRASDGSFRCPPNVVPRVLHDRMVRELFSRAGAKLKQDLVKSVETMTEIAGNKELDPAVRIKAAQWVIERVMGKTPDVQVNVEEKRYEKVFERIYRGEGMVVNGDVIDDGREP